KAVESEYVEREWRYAFDAGKVINPILRLGDYELLHAELKLIDTPDFRDDGRYPEQLVTLIRQISEPVAPLGKLSAVPSLPPPCVVGRARLEALKAAVVSDVQRLIGVTGTTARVGVHGMGGIGKSVLTSALARSPEVRRTFPDGVFWVPIGERPDLV